MSITPSLDSIHSGIAKLLVSRKGEVQEGKDALGEYVYLEDKSTPQSNMFGRYKKSDITFYKSCLASMPNSLLPRVFFPDGSQEGYLDSISHDKLENIFEKIKEMMPTQEG